MRTLHALITGLTIAGLMAAGAAPAQDGGELDTSFATTGWAAIGQSGYFNQAADVAVDSQGRVVVVGAGEIDLATGTRDIVPKVWRFLADGAPDTGFGTTGLWHDGIPVWSGEESQLKVALDPTNDHIYLGYTREYCETSCDPDDLNANLEVVHLDSDGSFEGSLSIAFDLGGALRPHDIFADIVRLADGRIAVAASVERSSDLDVDFGVALMTVDGDGRLHLDTSFATDGKTTCWFDHGGSLGKQDVAHAIAASWDQSALYVGGTAFEGNGTNSDGTNMALCEFSLFGALVGTWSTQAGGAQLDSREELRDIVVRADESLVVAGMAPGSGGFDYVLGRLDSSLNEDLAFGPDPTSPWATVGFSYPLVGDTDDHLSEIVIGPGGEITAGGTLTASASGLSSAVGLARFTSAGLLDTSWGLGGGGVAIHSLGSDLEDTCSGLARQADGKLLEAGLHVDQNAWGLVARAHGQSASTGEIFSDDFEDGSTDAWSSVSP